METLLSDSPTVLTSVKIVINTVEIEPNSVFVHLARLGYNGGDLADKNLQHADLFERGGLVIKRPIPESDAQTIVHLAYSVEKSRFYARYAESEDGIRAFKCTGLVPMPARCGMCEAVLITVPDDSRGGWESCASCGAI